MSRKKIVVIIPYVVRRYPSSLIKAFEYVKVVLIVLILTSNNSVSLDYIKIFEAVFNRNFI